ncbi:hypothetical protein NKY44_08830 [Sinorhizobium meliloti]|uniref:hypothetical protein n=1 Tax=Rhizobium meliloti TaxID=382 RepID=UPI003D655BFD
MTPFRWQNCYADVVTSSHDRTIRSYFDDVIVPALSSLMRRIDELGQSGDPVAVFERSDVEDVLRETKLAFALAIQSIWERQLREYLKGCALELRKNDPMRERIARADWPKLLKVFRDLRGIALEEFPSFGALDTLQHLGNACRHGDGASSLELVERCPDLWPVIPAMPFGDPQGFGLKSVDAMEVSIDRLRGFVDAIGGFWKDMEYIYNESINAKHPTLEARLARERKDRSWTPRGAGGEREDT